MKRTKEIIIHIFELKIRYMCKKISDTLSLIGIFVPSIILILVKNEAIS
jgi:hypothetical protein